MCINTFNRYECVCGSGYVSQTGKDGKLRCLNVNECKTLDAADLGHDCTCERCACQDIPGSYKCVPRWQRCRASVLLTRSLLDHKGVCDSCPTACAARCTSDLKDECLWHPSPSIPYHMLPTSNPIQHGGTCGQVHPGSEGRVRGGPRRLLARRLYSQRRVAHLPRLQGQHRRVQGARAAPGCKQ